MMDIVYAVIVFLLFEIYKRIYFPQHLYSNYKQLFLLNDCVGFPLFLTVSRVRHSESEKLLQQTVETSPITGSKRAR